METLVSGVQAWLNKRDNQNPKKLLPSPDRLLLVRLRKSCETYNMNEIDDIMDELECVDYSADASLITWLREKINASDFSPVISRLTAYTAE
jgi:hypothetical protein